MTSGRSLALRASDPLPASRCRSSSLVLPQGPEAGEHATEAAVASEFKTKTAPGRLHRFPCARQLKRVFGINRQHLT